MGKGFFSFILLNISLCNQHSRSIHCLWFLSCIKSVFVVAVSKCLGCLKPFWSLLHCALETPSYLRAHCQGICNLCGAWLLLKRAFSPLLSLHWQWGNQLQTQGHFVESDHPGAESPSAGGTEGHYCHFLPFWWCSITEGFGSSTFGDHGRQVGTCNNQRDSNHGMTKLKESQEVCSSISCSERSALGSHHNPQGCIQLGLQNLQGWRLQILVGQLFPNVLDCLPGEKVSADIQQPHGEAHLFLMLSSWLMTYQICREWQRVQPQALRADGDSAFSLTCLHLPVFLPTNQSSGLVVLGLCGWMSFWSALRRWLGLLSHSPMFQLYGLLRIQGFVFRVSQLLIHTGHWVPGEGLQKAEEPLSCAKSHGERRKGASCQVPREQRSFGMVGSNRAGFCSNLGHSI